MSEQFEGFKEWVSTIREDVDVLEQIIAIDKVDSDARRFCAAALNYMVQRMDLVPDWEESVGVLDDAMVMRVCVELASQRGLDEALEEPDQLVAVGRMVNEAKQVDSFLGAELGAQFRSYCAKLVDEVVRGRSTNNLVEEAEAREALAVELATELKRMPPAPFTDPDALSVKYKSYLAHKLKA